MEFQILCIDLHGTLIRAKVRQGDQVSSLIEQIARYLHVTPSKIQCYRNCFVLSPLDKLRADDWLGMICRFIVSDGSVSTFHQFNQALCVDSEAAKSAKHRILAAEKETAIQCRVCLLAGHNDGAFVRDPVALTAKERTEMTLPLQVYPGEPDVVAVQRIYEQLRALTKDSSYNVMIGVLRKISAMQCTPEKMWAERLFVGVDGPAIQPSPDRDQLYRALQHAKEEEPVVFFSFSFAIEVQVSTYVIPFAVDLCLDDSVLFDIIAREVCLPANMRECLLIHDASETTVYVTKPRPPEWNFKIWKATASAQGVPRFRMAVVPRPPPIDFEKGTVLLGHSASGLGLPSDQYQVVRKLGAGGFGSVFQVVRPDTREVLVLKLGRMFHMYRPKKHGPAVSSLDSEFMYMNSMLDNAASDGGTEWALDAARRNLLLVKDSPCISIVTFNSAKPPLHGLLLPFLDHGDLHHRLFKDSGQQHTLLSVGDACLLAVNMLRALRAFHLSGFVHLDVKPRNIMFTFERPSDAVLVDYGTASLVYNPFVQSGTGPRAGGTAHFASIWYHQDEDLSFRDDLMSLGFTLYQACVGELPWIHLRDDRAILQAKLDAMPALTKCSVKPLASYFQYVLNLQYEHESTVDYTGLLRLFEPQAAQCFSFIPHSTCGSPQRAGSSLFSVTHWVDVLAGWTPPALPSM